VGSAEDYRGRVAALIAALDLSAALAERRLELQAEAGELVVAEIGDDGREHRLIPAAADAWRAMRAAARADGVDLRIASAFRSVERQAEILREKLERGQAPGRILEVSAPPGYSEHHTGRAVDVTTEGARPLEASFEQTAAYRWLGEHAGEFSFFLSYPRGNAAGYAFEPWHWCYRSERA
jgi:D-alanyl-D-alanine carboxypeptidase